MSCNTLSKDATSRLEDAGVKPPTFQLIHNLLYLLTRSRPVKQKVSRRLPKSDAKPQKSGINLDGGDVTASRQLTLLQ